jgi:hypothetical protein
LAGALEQFAKSFDSFAISGGEALLEETIHGRLQVTVLHHVVGEQLQELVDVHVIIVIVTETTKAVADGH